MSHKKVLTRSRKKRGKELLAHNRVTEAQALYEKICEIDGADAEAWFTLGSIYQHIEAMDRAGACYQRVAALDPGNPEPHFFLGVVHAAQGKWSDAEACYRETLRLKPGHLRATCNLGNLLENQHLYVKAIEYYHTALRFHPESPELHFNLGCACIGLGQIDEAIQAFERAIAHQPSFALAYTNLGFALERQRRLVEAITCYEKGLQLSRLEPTIYNNLAGALKKIGRLHEACERYRAALKANPDNAILHSNLLLALNYLPDITPDQLYREHVKWSRHHAKLISAPTSFSNSRNPHRRLRVGYLSPDFRIHSVSYFIESILAHHDQRTIESFCYADVGHTDGITAHLRQLAMHWRDVSILTNEQIVSLVRSDEIDILIDLAGHTGARRLSVFAHKPAPVQVSYLGYPNTTGLSTIDYRLTDTIADPPGADAFHTETLVRLENGFLCYTPPVDAPAIIAPKAVKEYVTFGCMNTLEKINDAVLSKWGTLMSRVPDAHLLIKNNSLSDPRVREELASRLRAFGIRLERVEFEGWATLTSAHLHQYGRVNIALDTFPYNGTTTTCEALWMGVPVVTLAGDRHAGRVGLSLLTRVGLTELVAQTPDDYVRVATELAMDTGRLAVLRLELRNRMRASPLCNGIHFTHEVEAAYRQMWQAWCDQTSKPL